MNPAFGGCKWRRNSVCFSYYSLGSCWSNSSLHHLSPSLSRFRWGCQTLCRCLCRPYFSPWPLSSSVSSVYTLCVVLLCNFTIGLVLQLSGLDPLHAGLHQPRRATRLNVSPVQVLLLRASSHPSPPWLPSAVLQAASPRSFPSQGALAAGKQPRHRADPAAPCAYLSSSPHHFLALAPCASCARAPREPARQVGLQPAFPPCSPPSCIIKYQILSWNADTVNSPHCSCLIYRINKVVKEFKDVFQTGPSFFSTCWRTHL